MLELINNKVVKVTKIILNPKESTGFHEHKLDYVIVPVTNGKLKLIDSEENYSYAALKIGEPYYRKAGVKHDVINASKNVIIFLEIEIKINRS